MTLKWKAALVGMVLMAGTGWIQAKDMPAGSVDPLTAAPDMYTLVFQNDRVRVMQVVFKPGQSIKEHTHPNDHFVYALEGGQLTIHKKDAKPSVVDITKGQVLWIPAETHWAKNTGTTEVKLLVSKLKSK